MTQLLMLDAAYPPGAYDLIADITAVGGQGAFLYVWGPYVNGSPAHVQALRASGLEVAPIIVPGNLGGDPPTMVRTCQAWGFLDGPVFFDFERGSLPSNAWWDNARDIFRAHGFHADRYGTTSVLGQYDPGDADWIASWIRTGILEPLPTLPEGWTGWQFVNDITVNGHQYDASVMLASLFGEPPMTRNEWAAIYRLHLATLLRRDPQPVQQQPDPHSGGTYYENYMWADWTLSRDAQDIGARDFVTAVIQEGRHMPVPDATQGPAGPVGPAGPPGKDGAPGQNGVPNPGTYTAQVVFPKPTP